MKRFKVILRTSTGIKTATFEAENEEDAERMGLASLEAWEKPATATAQEVGSALRRTMP